MRNYKITDLRHTQISTDYVACAKAYPPQAAKIFLHEEELTSIPHNRPVPYSTMHQWHPHWLSVDFTIPLRSR